MLSTQTFAKRSLVAGSFNSVSASGKRRCKQRGHIGPRLVNLASEATSKKFMQRRKPLRSETYGTHFLPKLPRGGVDESRLHLLETNASRSIHPPCSDLQLPACSLHRLVR